MRLDLKPRACAVARILLSGGAVTIESLASELGISPATAKIYRHQIIIATGQDSILPAMLAILRDERALAYVMRH